MDMNGVDRADQLVKYYEIGAHIRNTKWWWSIFLWALGTASVNAYLLYKGYMISHGTKPLRHYEFRKSIALGWLDWKKIGQHATKTQVSQREGRDQGQLKDQLYL